MKWTPHDYQKKAIKFLIQHATAGLFLDPGLGKTSISLMAFKLLKQRGIVRGALVIAPLRPMQSTWPAEAQKWDEFRDLRVGVLHGSDKEQVLKDYLRGRYDVVCINPEGLPWLFAHEFSGDWPFQVLIVDESTRFKHANTVRFKKLKPYLPRFQRRYILTGTPAPNGLLDLFGQVYILDLGNALGRFVTHYRSAFFDPTGFGGFNWKPKADAADRIYRRLAPLVLRMDAADYLQLPPLIHNRVTIELPPEARKVYREMEDLLITELAAGKVVAANAAVASGKCRQICNGGIYGANHEAHHIHEAKVDATEEIVEELQGTPALVAYEFEHDLERLQRRFGGGVPWIGGGVSTKRFKEIETGWNAGELPLVFAQPQSVAHGLNLQGTRAAIIEHSLGWNLEDRDQFIKRVWRQGQKFPTFVHSLVARDTIDEIVVLAVAGKDRTQRALLDALKRWRR